MTDSKPQFKGMGKSMLTLSWIILLIGLTYAFGIFESNQYNPNKNPDSLTTEQFREISLQRNAYNHYVTTGKINGVDVVFMLDTGATHVAVPGHLAGKLRLTPGARMMVSTANGNAEVRATKIDKLMLGTIQLQNVQASITPGMTGDEILLGMSVLKQLDFNQSGKTLTLRQYLN